MFSKKPTSELKKLEEKCHELRQFIIKNVAENGGHLGAALGVVELTVALHEVFKFEGQETSDKLIWDVGHQAYAHKILTGRKNSFHTLRKWKGLSGFPSRKESIFDDFGTGHSSTSISAILGMALAASWSEKSEIQNRWHVAVIGDGAFTAGMPFEALNNIQNNLENGIKLNVLIILNDNGMSIDPNVGTLKSHFQSLFKYKWQKGQKISQTSNEPTLFDFFGATFLGSIDGHNLEKLLDCLEELQKSDEKGVFILHLKTIKGKGILKNSSVKFESKYNSWHSPAKFNPETGVLLPQKKLENTFLKFQTVFGKTLLQLALQNKKIVVITPAMASGSSLLELQDKLPNRTFDVGIAEQHAVTFSAGLASQNLLPFCVIYSTFLQRAYDSLIHDVCVQGLKVIFCIDRAGLVGADGATHQGVYDIAYLRPIPNLILAAPMDELEFQKMLFTTQSSRHTTAFAIRYPRGEGFIFSDEKQLETLLKTNSWKEELEIGKARVIKALTVKTEVLVLSYGMVGNFVKEATNELGNSLKAKVSHFDMRFCKPLDKKLLFQALENQNLKHIITIEDGSKIGGFGSAILETLSESNSLKNLDSFKILGVPDEIIPQGFQKEQYQYCRINKDSLLKEFERIFG